ncbi:MAG: hypothetical protein NTY04_03920 [Candidatus Staskawiczbacteria bacterium]|nr:hypothetical protein [Candidatus Staskawiczbacteria bacterium]
MDAQHKKRVLGITIGLAGAMLVISTCWYGFSSKPNKAAAQSQSPPVVATPAPMPAPPPVPPVAPPPQPPPPVDPQPSADATELANLRKQVEDMKKLCADQMRVTESAVEGLKKGQQENQALQEKLRAAAQPQPQPEVMQALGKAGASKDMILNVWTGLPAVLHELKKSGGARPQPHFQPGFRPEPVRRVCGPSPEVQRRIAELKNSIESADNDLSIEQQNLAAEVAAWNADNRSDEGRNASRQRAMERIKQRIGAIERGRKALAAELIQLERQIRQQ